MTNLILNPHHLQVVTKEEVVEDGRLEQKLDQLIKIDLEILKKLT